MSAEIRGRMRSVLAFSVALVMALGVVAVFSAAVASADEDHDEHDEPGTVMGDPNVEFTLWAYIEGFQDANGNKNPRLVVNHDDIVKITIINGNNYEHDLLIDELGVHSDHMMALNDQVEVIFVADTLGTFTYYCNVPGHSTTMQGSFVVQEPGAGDLFAGISAPMLAGIIAGVVIAAIIVAVLFLRNGRKPT